MKTPKRIRFTLIMLVSLIDFIFLITLVVYLLNFLDLSFRDWVWSAILSIVVMLIDFLLAGFMVCLLLDDEVPSFAQIIGILPAAAAITCVTLCGFWAFSMRGADRSEYVVERDGIKRIISVSKRRAKIFEYKNWTIGWVIRGKWIVTGREQTLSELCEFYQNGSIPLSHPSCQYVFERMKEKQEAP